MSTLLRSCCLLTVISAVCVTSLARDNVENPSESPRFTSRTELVLVPVVVKDSSGKHVSGLTSDAFSLKQDGRLQRVTVFEEVKAATATHLEKPVLPLNTWSNEVGERRPRQLVIIAIDAINTSFLDVDFARKQLLKFISETLDSDSMVAVAVIGRGGRVRLIHNYTADSKLLAAALQPLLGKTEVTDAAIQQQQLGYNDDIVAEKTVVSDFLSQSPGVFLGQNEDATMEYLRILDTLHAVQQVTLTFAGVPGRKSLVWMTAGFPFGDPTALRDVLPEYEKTWHILSDANTSMYPVDVRGLVSPAIANPKLHATEAMRAMADEVGQRQNVFTTMDVFADMTGGRAFYNSNDVRSSLHQAADDSAAFYLLGYYLERSSKAGWHKLSVKVNQPKVHVRTRSGFYSGSAALTPDTAADRDIALALDSTTDFSGVPMTVKLTGTKPDAENKTYLVDFGLMLPTGAVEVDKAEQNAFRLQIAGIAYAADGKTVDRFEQHVQGHLSAEAAAKMHNGLYYTKTFKLPPGGYTLKFAVCDRLSGKIGSVTVPLTLGGDRK